MKTFIILVILYILPGFAAWKVNAQFTRGTCNLTENKIKNSLSNGLILPCGQSNTSQLSRQFRLRKTWTDKKNIAGSDYYSTYLNHYDLINMQVRSIDAIVRSPFESGPESEIEIAGTFNINLENRYGIPFIDPAIAYYCPYKKTAKPTLCGCCFYHVASFLIPRMALFSYPGGNSTKIYPPAYMQPRVLLTDMLK